MSLVVVGRRVAEGESVAGDIWLCQGVGCGWKALRRVLSRVLVVVLDSKCLEGVAYRVSPASPIGLGFFGASLVMFDCVIMWVGGGAGGA